MLPPVMSARWPNTGMSVLAQNVDITTRMHTESVPEQLQRLRHILTMSLVQAVS
jgi:hypothetical protein